MTEWLTASQIARRALPGMPKSKRGVAKVAEREGWAARRGHDDAPLTRAVKGRGVEYHVSLLPDAARVVVAASVISAREPAKTAPPAAASEALVRDARLAILTVQRAHAVVAGLTLRKSDDAFAAAYNSGAVEVDAWVRSAIVSLSPRTLRRWREHAERAPQRLASRQGRTGLGGVLESANEGAVAELIGGALARQPHLTAKHVRALVRATFGDAFDVVDEAGQVRRVPLPKERAFRRFIADWTARNTLALTKLTDPDRFKSAYRVSGLSRYQGLERLNQVWEVDASPADMLCTDGRHQVYVLVDVWSRRLMTFVTRTPRAEAVLLLVRKAILAWGVPEMVKTDNGSDFKAHAVRRSFASLSIAHELCDPFSPEQKGVVERAIGTMQRDLMPLLPGYVGHSVADRKAIESRRSFATRLGDDADKAFAVELSAAELQAYADTWAEAQYGQAPHSSLPQRMSPFARAAGYPGRVKRIEDARALDILLAPIAGRNGLRTVGKQGLKIDGAYFLSSSLMPGEQVLVRHDAQDMGRVFCFSVDGARYLAEATCPERVGVDRAEAVARARAEQARLIREQVEPIRRAAKRIKPRDMVDAILGQAQADAGKVVAFPKPSETHSTPALAAAAEAAAPRTDRLGPRRLSADAEAAYQKLVAGELDRADEKPVAVDAVREAFERDFATPRAATAEQPRDGASTDVEFLSSTASTSNVVSLPDPARLRARRAYEIEQALLDVQGRTVSEDEARWFAAYRETPEYRAHRAMVDDFGAEWLAS